MNWQWKARIQNAVAALPMSNSIYYAMQRTTGSLRPGRHNPMMWLRAAADMVEWARQAGQEITGKRFLEMGTGRRLNIPTALWLCGAGSIVTVDLYRYLSGKLVAETIDFLRRHQEEVFNAFGAEAEAHGFKERFNQLISHRGNLTSLLKLMNIEYGSPVDATKLPYPDHSFDFHISYTVLQHIPGDIILKLLEEARRVLTPGGLLIHFVDLSDMFSHDDHSITEINFLQFSEEEWGKLAGNQFMYHNRLRAHEYMELFRRAGVRVLEQKQTVNEAALHALKTGSLKLDGRFRDVPPEQLAVGRLRVLGTFS